MPTATISGRVPSASIRMPASLAPPHSTSFGHLNASRDASAGASRAIASWVASAATKDSCGAWSGGAGSVRSSVANRLPGSDTQLRPRRPRPPVWAPAVIHKGPFSPARA